MENNQLNSLNNFLDKRQSEDTKNKGNNVKLNPVFEDLKNPLIGRAHV